MNDGFGFWEGFPVTGQDIARAEALDQAMVDLRHQERMAAGFSVADEINKLEQLRTSGSLSPEEFDQQRRRILTPT